MKRLRGWIPDNWFQPMDDVHPPADVFPTGESSADAYKTADGRENRQHY